MRGFAWLDRLAPVLGWGPVATARAVLDRYGRAGGPLLAGGLAYSALFAIVPLLFVAAGLTGLLVDNEAERTRVVETIANVLPPLRDLASLILAEASRAAGTISLVGLLALLWGGSRFLLAFEDAMARMTDGPRSRGAIARNLLGMVVALVLVMTVVIGAAIAGLTAFLDAASVIRLTSVAVSLVERVVLELLPPGLSILAVLLVYRFIPEVRPAWRAAWRPAWVVAVVLTVATRLFVFIAPRLIGAAATIGALATAFAGLAWFGFTFQAILLGAAWVRERDAARRIAPTETRVAG